MSDAAKISALYESFVTEFLQPLFSGGTAQQTRALPSAMLDHFATVRPASFDVEDAIVTQMAAIAAEISPAHHLPFPDRGTMATAMALHDLAALTDPLLGRSVAKSARPRILDWIDELTEAIAPPETRGEALARHTVWHRFLDVSREDSVVKNWAYTYRFYGRPAPANVVALPKLRFVREQRTQQTLLTLWQENDGGDLDLATRFRQLLSRSPVTELLRSDLAPDLQLGAASLAVLSDGGLRNGIVQAMVKRGTQHVAQPLGHALRVLHALGPPPEYLYVAAAFLCELQLLEVLDERVGHEPRAEPSVGDEELFSAVLPALVDHEGPLDHMLALSEPDLALVRERAELRRRQCGEDAVAFAAAILARARPIETPQTQYMERALREHV